MRIRDISEREIPLVADYLIERFHGEFTDTLPPINRKKVVQTVYLTWRDGRVLIAEDGEIRGAIGLTRSGPWYADTEFYQDQWFFVSKDRRNFKVSAALLKAAQIASDKDGLPLRIAASVGGRVPAMDRLFRRAGFERVGGIYERA